MKLTTEDIAEIIREIINAKEIARDIVAAINKTEICKWRNEEEGNWHTSCKNIFILLEGTPFDNNMVYCPYCGKKIEEECEG